jgi:hypothetical protein
VKRMLAVLGLLVLISMFSPPVLGCVYDTSHSNHRGDGSYNSHVFDVQDRDPARYTTHCEHSANSGLQPWRLNL